VVTGLATLFGNRRHLWAWRGLLRVGRLRIDNKTGEQARAGENCAPTSRQSFGGRSVHARRQRVASGPARRDATKGNCGERAQQCDQGTTESKSRMELWNHELNPRCVYARVPCSTGHKWNPRCVYARVPCSTGHKWNPRCVYARVPCSTGHKWNLRYVSVRVPCSTGHKWNLRYVSVRAPWSMGRPAIRYR
jgi:hypothetical protein